jgi:hypothetical protein
MKRILYITILAVASLNTQAQYANETLKYSFNPQLGTARNLATGGAMASLGGEFTSLFVNPAGLGLFKTNELVISPRFNLGNNTANFRGTNNNRTFSDQFGLGASGYLWSTPEYTYNQEGKGKRRNSFAAAIGVNQTANFNSNIGYTGINNVTSYSEKYLEELIYNNVRNPNQAGYQFPFASAIAFNTYLVDPVFTGGTLTGYRSLANNALATGLRQTNRLTTTGGTHEITLGGALNSDDKFYMGASAGIAITSYERNTFFEERDVTNNSTNQFNYFQVNDKLEQFGAGLNLKFGAIYKPVEQVRLGISIHTPTWFNITEQQNTSIETDTEGYKGVQRQTSQDVINYRTGTLGENITNESEYIFRTPWRFMLSGSYVFREVSDVRRQKAFITADLEYINYGGVNFKPQDEEDVSYEQYLQSVRQETKDLYRSAINARIGGEIKFNIFMVRLGAAYYGNPNQDKSVLKTQRINLSGGLGYRHKGIFIDLGYMHSFAKDVNLPYRLADPDRPNTFATLKQALGTAILTVGFKL